MASVEFKDIYSRFYLRVKDYETAGLEEDLVNEILQGYLKATLSKPMMRRLFNSLTFDDDVEELEFELRESLDESSDIDFVQNICALGIVEEWCSPRYHSTLLTSQLLTNTDQKFFSQAAHLAEMKEMYQKAQIDLRKLIRDWSYNVSVINGVTT